MREKETREKETREKETREKTRIKSVRQKTAFDFGLTGMNGLKGYKQPKTRIPTTLRQLNPLPLGQTDSLLRHHEGTLLSTSELCHHKRTLLSTSVLRHHQGMLLSTSVVRHYGTKPRCTRSAQWHPANHSLFFLFSFLFLMWWLEKEGMVCRVCIKSYHFSAVHFQGKYIYALGECTQLHLSEMFPVLPLKQFYSWFHWQLPF